MEPSQVAISCLSLSSITLAYWPRRDWRFWGALLGLSAQPFWAYVVWTNGMWGIAPLTPVYTALYLVAIRNHWRK
jgi:hypothetical protein